MLKKFKFIIPEKFVIAITITIFNCDHNVALRKFEKVI